MQKTTDDILPILPDRKRKKNVEYVLRILKTRWTLNNLIDILYFYMKFRTDADFNTDK